MTDKRIGQLGSAWNLGLDPALSASLVKMGETVRALQLSPVLSAARQASLLSGYERLQMNQFKALAESLADSPLKAMMADIERFKGSLDIKMVAAAPLGTMFRDISFKTSTFGVRRFDSQLMSTLLNLDEARLGHLLDTWAERSIREPIGDAVEVGDFASLETDSTPTVPTEIKTELVSSLSGDADARNLSPAAWIWLTTLLNILVALLGSAADMATLQTWIEGLQSQTVAAGSNAEVRKIIFREASCSAPADALSAYRYVSSERVHLREAPGMKAEILEELPRGVLLEVLGSEGRSWLHVHLKHDGVELDGFIARRYTKRCVNGKGAAA